MTTPTIIQQHRIHQRRFLIGQLNTLAGHLAKGKTIAQSADLMGIGFNRAHKLNSILIKRMRKEIGAHLEQFVTHKRLQYAHILSELWIEWENSKHDSKKVRIQANLSVMDRILNVLNDERRMLGIDKVSEVQSGGVVINWDTLLLAHKMQQMQDSATVQIEAHKPVSTKDNASISSSGSESHGIPNEKSYTDEIDERIEKLERMAIKREEELDDDPLAQRTVVQTPVVPTKPVKRLILKPLKQSTT